jgi:hypothetical protein
MNFFKSGVRRLEQGLLEQIGATTSSRDATFDADDQRWVAEERQGRRKGAPRCTPLLYTGVHD